MYSGVLLMSFVLAEYIMTNKPWTGLGTEDWAICRLEFILMDILAHRAPYSRKKGKNLIKKAHISYGDIIPKTYICNHVPNGEGTLSDICWLKKMSTNLSFSLTGYAVVWSWDAHWLVKSNDVLRLWWEGGHNKTSMVMTWKTITDITER